MSLPWAERKVAGSGSLASGLHIHRSNRLEKLISALSTLLQTPRGGPLDPEIVAAPGQGMAVWLSMQLARRLGVWAAPIRFPRELIDHLMVRVLGDDARELSAVSRDAMAFAIQAELPGLLQDPAFEALLRYLESDEFGVRRAELALRLGATFDQYLTYRSDWLRQFESGANLDVPEDNRFQATLFRKVVARLQRKHLAELEPRMLELLSSELSSERLPARISIFGVSTLPPLFVRILAQVARHIEVHFFLFSPGAEAWSKQAGERSRHTLLNRFGAVGSDFDQVLSACADAAGLTPTQHDLFEAPPNTSLLGALQTDLFGAGHAKSAPESAREMGEAAFRSELESARAAQAGFSVRSLSVHSCHGAMREVEVLHDQLTALLTRPHDPVRPEEVVVMVSDLETYAPLIDAVFARESSSPEFIPYVVSDTLLSLDASTLRAFDRILGMVRGRVTASEVLDLLTVPAILARFELDLLEADRLRDWLCDSGVRWGMDAEHRARMGVPASDNNTFKLGMQRLMLGYALPTGGEALFEGVLPFEELEGQDLVLLGKFASFRRTLFDWLRELEQPRSVPEWVETLTRLLDDLFSESVESAARLSRVRRALAELSAAASTARYVDTLQVEVVSKLISQKLRSIAPEHAYLSEGVTFCAMLPMRNVPFRVVCALGMNDSTFPRTPPLSEFDLMQGGFQPARPGDRSLREDDRYLFLEALCQAREQLLLFYTGRSVRDNKPRPPSRCVGELLDHLETNLGVPRRELLVEHRLQGFSRAYFDQRDARLFSYSKSYLNAARSMARAQSNADPFVGKALELDLPASLRLDDLVRFFRSPPAFYLNRRLGIYLDEEDVDISDREPLELSALDNWRLGSALIEHLLKGRSLEETAELLAASLELPHGSWGTVCFEHILETCRAIARATEQARGGGAEPVLRLQIELPLLTLTGSIDGRFKSARVEHGYSAAGPKQLVKLGVRHLAMCAAGSPSVSVAVLRSSSPKAAIDTISLNPLEPASAQARLETLVGWFAHGQSLPLPFLPVPSQAYVKALRGKAPQEALDKAIRAYAESNRTGIVDQHVERIFRGLMPPFDIEYDQGRKPLEQTDFHGSSLAFFTCFDDLIAGGES